MYMHMFGVTLEAVPTICYTASLVCKKGLFTDILVAASSHLVRTSGLLSAVRQLAESDAYFQISAAPDVHFQAWRELDLQVR